MNKEGRLARIRSELEEDWNKLSEEIDAVRKDLSFEMSEQNKIKLERKLSNLERSRDRIGKRLDRIEQGNYQFSENIIADSINDLRNHMSEEAKERTGMRRRIVNGRPHEVILNNFKDRIEKKDELCQCLADHGICLISVEGQPGIGKTALVYKVFSDLEKGKLIYKGNEQKIDGIIYLDARSEIITIEQIFSSVVQLLGNEIALELRKYWSSERAKLQDRASFLLSKLQGGFYLLVIDNFELLLNECLEIIDESLKVFLEQALINSEHSLHIVVISCKRLYFPPPLSSRIRRIEIRKGLPELEAIEYLRSLDPNGDFGLKEATEQLLLQVVQKVNGIPRALENICMLLASDWNLSLDTLLKNEKLFSGQVTDNLMNESFRQLLLKEQMALGALAVYNREVNLVAIAYILNGLDPCMDVAESLRWLVYRHFIIFDRSSGLYGMLSLTRDFIYYHLPNNVCKDFEKRAASFFKSIRYPKDEWKDLEYLKPCLFEFEHLVNAGEFCEAAKLLDEIEDNHLRLWGYYRQIIKMRAKLCGKLPGLQLECVNQVKLGRSYAQAGDQEKALGYLEHGADLAKKLNDPKLLGISLGSLGLLFFSIGKYEPAMDYFNKALKMAHEANDLKQEAHIRGCLANGYRRNGERHESQKNLIKALSLDRKLLNKEGEARRLFDLGVSKYFEGNLKAAKRYLEKSLSIAQDKRYTALECQVLGNLGNINLILNTLATAEQYCEKALTIARQTACPRSEARNLAFLGDIYFQVGEYEKAAKFHTQAILLAVKTEDYDGECIWQIKLGFDQICIGSVFIAKETFEKSISDCKRLFNYSPAWHDFTRYYFCLAMVGLAITDSGWPESKLAQGLITDALTELGKMISKAPWLRVIQPIFLAIIHRLVNIVGISGLEPIEKLIRNWVT